MSANDPPFWYMGGPIAAGSGTVTSVELTSDDGTVILSGTNPITGSGVIDLSVPPLSYYTAGVRFVARAAPGIFSSLNAGAVSVVRNSPGNFTVSWNLPSIPFAITMSLEDFTNPGIVCIGPLDYDQTFVNVITADLTGTPSDLQRVVNIIAIGPS